MTFELTKSGYSLRGQRPWAASVGDCGQSWATVGCQRGQGDVDVRACSVQRAAGGALSSGFGTGKGIFCLNNCFFKKEIEISQIILLSHFVLF
jgi:hypothetical protein